MNANSSITLQAVANGWIVRPVVGPESVYATSETRVFQTFGELVGWLAEHFTHRQNDVRQDVAPSAE